jgi:predicted alpha/beta superfamily hydrolase
MEETLQIEGNEPVVAVVAAPIVAGQLRIHQFKSKIFGNKRMLRVWLPPAYDAPENRGRRYPVLYLNDGQNLFEASTSYTGVEWQVDESAARLIHEGRIAPLIVVGIDNAQGERMREYVPYRSADIPEKRVEGKQYPEFLLKEVFPYVARRYRVARGAENTGLGGSSLAALISLYTAITHPHEFGRLLLESPSLFVANRRLIRDSARVRRWPERVFLGIGTQETSDENRNRQVVEDVRALAQVIHQAGLGGERLRVDIDEGANHSEWAWAKRFPEALMFLYAS